MQHFAQFSVNCLGVASKLKIHKKVAYKAYHQWCQQQNIPEEISGTAFQKFMVRSHRNVSFSKKNGFYTGVGLRGEEHAACLKVQNQTLVDKLTKIISKYPLITLAMFACPDGKTFAYPKVGVVKLLFGDDVNWEKRFQLIVRRHEELMEAQDPPCEGKKVAELLKNYSREVVHKLATTIGELLPAPGVVEKEDVDNCRANFAWFDLATAIVRQDVCLMWISTSRMVNMVVDHVQDDSNGGMGTDVVVKVPADVVVNAFPMYIGSLRDFF